MIDDTILVVDADHETEEKIVSTLEAEGYIVFTASGRDVSTGMAEKISPALIYLKPGANSVEGFEVCKTIHNMEKYRQVPVVLLASLKGPLDPRYTTYYGVVDYLKMPLRSEELIEMTEKVLGSRPNDLVEPEKNIGPITEKSVPAEEPPASLNLKEMPEEEVAAEEEEMPVTEGPAAADDEFADMSEVGQPDETYSYKDSEEDVKEGLFNRVGRRRPRKSSLLSPFVVAAAVIAIAVAGLLGYKFFISTPEVKAPVAVKQQLPPAPPPPQQPAPEQQKQEKPAAEAKPAEIKEAPKEAPSQKTASVPAPVVPTKPSASVPAAKVPAPVAATKSAAPVAATKAPIIAEATKPSAKAVYSVQLGAFKGESGAKALEKTYKGKGYEVFTQKVTTDKGTFYRVLIGEFNNRKEASKLAAKIENKERIKTTIFSGATK